ncbi:MAG: hypothetical protein K9N07_02985 [Candidatus Cloacimonetes bacterium]|nr:hypothetical protein [Candidatus Cloacimonadota bacterium]
MKNSSWILIIMLIITGCSKNQEIYRQKFTDKYEVPALPGWIYKTPEKFVVGISLKSSNKNEMKEAAKQMAAVIESRNNSSYTIDNYASTTSDNILKSGKSQFKLNVSSSPERTEEICNALTLVDSLETLGYFFGLFSTENNKKPRLKAKLEIQQLPENFEDDKLEIFADTINFHKTASSSSLISAWKTAAEEARYEIAKYLEKQVQSAIINTDENTEKRIVLETSKLLSRMRLNKSYIITELKDNLRIFKVYHEMEIKK